MKALIFTAFLLLGASASTEDVPPDKLDHKIAEECRLGGGCYAVPKAAIDKMRGLFTEQRDKIEAQDAEIRDLREKLPRSCA